jgi:hypothetical protein
MSLAAWSFLIATLGLVISVLSYFSSRGAISREQTDREKAIDDAWSFEWASQRPVVYPVLSGVVSGSTALPLKNGGRGPALNVVAELEYRNQDGKPDGAWRRVVGTIAAGDVVTAIIGPSVAPPWAGISGVLRFGDLAGGEYEAPFRFSPGPDGQLELTVDEQQHRTGLEVREARAGGQSER